MSEEENKKEEMEGIDLEKLNSLAAKIDTTPPQEQSMAAEKLQSIDKNSKSINWGVIGMGQCGSKLAQIFYQKGYNTICINTAKQDLQTIRIPDKNKLFLDVSLGGTGKDLDLGASAIEQYESDISDCIDEHLGECDMIYVIASGGGGSGSGGCVPMLELLQRYERPLGMIYVLPMESEGSLVKHNTVITLSKVAQLAATEKLNSLLIVDNAKIESIYPNLPQSQFWETANNAIVEPLHLFNHLSSLPSNDALDSMDFGRVLALGDCSLVGMMEVDDYMEELSIAEAVMQNLENGLLADGFDLAQTRGAAVIITGNKDVLAKIPVANINYGFALVGQKIGAADLFKGVFEVQTHSNSIKVYSMFSGLGLPDQRIDGLKLEAERHLEQMKAKEDNRSTNMAIDFGPEKNVTQTEKIYDRIKKSKSGFGKMKQNSNKKIVDKRRK